MCGICGIAYQDPNLDVDTAIAKAVEAMGHRGPDDRGVQSLSSSHSRAVFGHNRLSIIDLSAAGHQPMSNEDGSLWITYNGEVYNYQAIREELRGLGFQFRSDTDTEVVLKAYEAWGVQCLTRFDGMFAFAVFDTKAGRLFLARDRLGIKPLYYAERGDRLCFASEVRALLKIPGVTAEANWQAVLAHLVFLWAPEPETAFDGILKLPAGHYAIWENGRFSLEKYWDITIDPGPPESETSAIATLDDMLSTSVRERLMSDVPVGTLLSGGLDSSLISAMMAREVGPGFSTYSISFAQADQAFEAMPDDSKYARIVADHLGSRHEEIEIRPDIADLLPGMIAHLDEPIADPAAINTFLICKMARDRGIKVLLSGMGADEVFGGYRKHLSVILAQRYKTYLPQWLRTGVVSPLIQKLPVGSSKGGFRLPRWAKRFDQSASLPDIDCFIGNYAYYSPADLHELLSPDHRVAWEQSYGVKSHYDLLEGAPELDLLGQMTYLDCKLFLPSLNLAYSDKASMAASVEIRVPFVDHELLNFGLSLPASTRIKGLRQKWALKEVARNYLPREVVDRPKAPFGAPLRSWMRRDLAPMVDEYLSETSIKKRGYFDHTVVRRMIDDNRDGREDYAHRLWALLTMEIWHRIFVDGEIDPSLPA